MVDYYQLLSRAVEGIPPSMPGARRALYERARKLLATELQGPMTTAHDVEAERVSLENAIARVEAEFTPRPTPQRSEPASEPTSPIVQMPSPEHNPGKPSLSDLMRIVDEAMKDPAPPLRSQSVRRDPAPTPFLRTPSRNIMAGQATAPKFAAISTVAARAPNPTHERQPSEGPELRLLIGKEPQREAELPTPKKADLDRILRNLQTTSPGIEASALISRGGQMIASAMAPRMDETRIAGVTATLLNLGGRASIELARGEVREVVVRADHGYAVIIGAGQDAVLLTLANESSTLGYIFFGMQETVRVLEKVM